MPTHIPGGQDFAVCAPSARRYMVLGTGTCICHLSARSGVWRVNTRILLDPLSCL